MAIRELFGVKITDRVTVEYDQAADAYTSRFDGELISRHCGPYGGEKATRAAAAWLKARQQSREAAAVREQEDRARRQAAYDDEFLDWLGRELGVGRSRIDQLIDIIRRRQEAGL